MKVILFLLLSLIAVNCVSFTDITNATLYTLNFPATTDVNSQDRVFVIQRIFVPQNLQQIEVLAVAVTFDNTICSDPEIQIGSRGIPCAVANPDFPVIGISPCDDYAENEGGDNIFTGNSVEGGIEDFTIGTYWYLSIRKIDIEFALNCQFQVTTTISTCPTGQVGLGDDNPVVCLPLQPQIAANGASVTLPTTATTLIYYVNFATDQNLVTVTLNSTDFGTVSAYWGIPLTFDDNFFCYSGDIVNGQIIVTCNAVPAGNFYIVLEGGSGITSGSLKVNTNTCPTGFSGLACASPLALFTTTTVTGTVPAFTSGNFPQDLFYFVLVANTSVVWNITMTNTTGAAGQLVVRAGSFSYFDTLPAGTGGPGSIFVEFAPLPNALFFTPDDSYVGSKYYFSIVNTDTIPLSYTITSTYQVVTTTTGATAATAATGATGSVTTGATGSTTTGAKVTTGSNANSLFVPILLLVSLILALL